MSMNREGRPTRPEAADGAPATYTGNRALMLEEPLIFELGEEEGCGVDFEDLGSPAKAGAQSGADAGPRPLPGSRLGGLERNRPIGLPGLSEPQAVRHYTRLSRQNYAIDLGLF